MRSTPVLLTLALLLGPSLRAQDTWPDLPPNAWKLNTESAKEGILLAASVIRLTPLRLEEVRRFRVLPDAKPYSVLDISGEGQLLGRLIRQDGSIALLGPSAFVPGPTPGTRRPRELPGDGFLDLQICREPLDLDLMTLGGEQAMHWFPFPRLHTRIPLGGQHRMLSALIITSAESGYTAFQGDVDALVSSEATDGNAFLTELRNLPAASPTSPVLHWFDLPPALRGAQLDPDTFWTKALKLLKKVYVEDPSTGLFWSRKAKPYLESLPAAPQEAAETILKRLQTRLKLRDITLSDTIETPEHFESIPDPCRLGQMLDEGILTPAGRFHLAHRLFADAGLKPVLKFTVDPALGTLRLDVPSLFQITHVLLGVPTADGSMRWFNPNATEEESLVPPEALAKAPGLQVDSQGWTLKSAVPIP